MALSFKSTREILKIIFELCKHDFLPTFFAYAFLFGNPPFFVGADSRQGYPNHPRAMTVAFGATGRSPASASTRARPKAVARDASQHRADKFVVDDNRPSTELFILSAEID